ncbi:hypothetical protein [Clostridium thermarum]|uniref:hypothetical protein n=1 Tax=Clostridium thermarum TaxID=1716543 RepID=UPI00111ED7AD|nr:hypothetical protein [Clostridium thermarum]
MAGNSKINTIKQNARLKQFIGWLMAIMFPLAAKGLADMTPLAIIAVIAYWLFGGIVLRGIIDTRFPYLNIKLYIVKKELAATLVLTAAGIVLYVIHYSPQQNDALDILLGSFIFVLVNSIIEPLIWANIHDLSGCRIKIFGYLAVAINIFLMYSLFWCNYCRFLPVDYPGNAILQVLIFGIPVLIYEKSGDITIWNLQHILYSMVMLYAGGFDGSKLMQF